MKSKHYDVKRKRTISFFLDAAESIATKTGIDSLTIRNVADKAGYNSATIYNYFDSFDQLIAFMVIRKTRDYLNKSIWYYEQDAIRTIDDYIELWKIFCDYSFSDPVIYAYAYSSSKAHMNNYQSNIKKYYEIFSDTAPIFKGEDSHNPYLENEHDLVDQSLQKKNVEIGLYSEENASDIYQFGHYLYVGLLNDAIHDSERDPAKYTELFLHFFVPFLKSKAN